jgi:hypothetical protein
MMMKFEVRRSNDWNNKPCEEAIMETQPNIDIRRIDSPFKIWKTEEEVQKNWFNEGKNHRVENGRIIRDLNDEVYWVVEFKTLEELINFQDKYSEIKISDFATNPLLKLIEIKSE